MLWRVEALYLDNAATTALSPAVRAAMLPFLDESFGNPSSRHAVGVAAARAVEEAREQVAMATGSRAENVVFTAGGTEANNLAVLGLARAQRRADPTLTHILMGATEHPCTRDPATALAEEGFQVESLRLDGQAQVDLDDLIERLRPETALVTHMLVNNEFGSVYPIARLARLVRANAKKAMVHTDAVQALGKVEVSLHSLGVHSLAISAHKIHGPKGTGALILADGVRPVPLVFGGGQEGGVRSGTENVAGIVGLGRAAQDAHAQRVQRTEHMQALQDELARAVAGIEGACMLFPEGAALSPAIAAVRLPGPPAEVWMHHLEERGVMTSVGSACQAKKSEISPALGALGLSEAETKQVLRISFCGETELSAVRTACSILSELEGTLSRLTQ